MPLDDAIDWFVMGPKYRARVIELDARIAELEAEIERLRPRKSKPTEYLGPNCAR